MAFFLNQEELALIKIKHYDPADPLGKLFYKPVEQCVRFQQGIVTDNKDPDKMSRLRVHFPLWGDSVVTGWIPMVRPYGGKNQGLFMLPEIGQRVLCAFINDNPDRPVVVGSFYTPQHRPPAGDNKDNDRKIFTSPKGNTIILDDKDGAGNIQIFMKQGKMRLIMDKKNGLEIVNELGDIKIQCKKLTIEGEDKGTFVFKKGLTITGDSIDLKSDKGIGIKASGKVIIKGKIDLKSDAVVADNKQIAKENDQVVGIDFHDIMVPSPSGLVTVPMIPHPYMGKLKDKLSKDVKIKGKPAAMKGSKSKNEPQHICMPPGVQFKKPPNNEGEVSSGTVPKVKINGKEAAVLGSMVKTCSDPQPQETCTIIAIGVAPKLPIDIPVDDPIKRSLSNPKWSPTRAKIGEKLKLSVQLKKQYEYAAVEFKIFPDGANVDGDVPIQKVYGRNEGGKAGAEWAAFLPDGKKKSGKKPKFIFTAESFGCEKVKSGTAEITASIDLKFVDQRGDAVEDVKYTITMADGKKKDGNAGKNGTFSESDIVPGECVLKFKFNEDK